MKRLIAILALMILVLATGAFAECTDSDNGKTYGVKGATIYTKGTYQDTYEDFCTDAYTLVEYYCNGQGKVTNIFYHCDCVDGLCVGMAEEIPKEEIMEEEAIPPAETPTTPPVPPTPTPTVTPPSAASYAWVWIVVAAIVAVGLIMYFKKKK